MSIAAIFILTITIMLATSLFFLHGITNYLVSAVQEKIDITAYFKPDTKEEDILKAKEDIQKASPNIKEIRYVSQEEALNTFSQKHRDSDILLKALQEVGGNPFLPSLSIITNGDPSQYEQVSNILQSGQYNKLLDRVDFSQKKDIIEKVFSITSSINRFGIALSILLILIAVLIVFNTIKLAIDNSKEEITNMRIIGASDWFLRLPFIIQGALFGFVAFIISFIITVFASYFLSSSLSLILPGFILFNYFLSNILIFILLQIFFGVCLGVIISAIVVKKYLEV